MDKKTLAVFNIAEHDGKAVWRRIGIATTNRDGSINVTLDAVPVNGKLHIREVAPSGSDTD